MRTFKQYVAEGMWDDPDEDEDYGSTEDVARVVHAALQRGAPSFRWTTDRVARASWGERWEIFGERGKQAGVPFTPATITVMMKGMLIGIVRTYHRLVTEKEAKKLRDLVKNALPRDMKWGELHLWDEFGYPR